MWAKNKDIQIYRGDDCTIVVPHEWDSGDITEVRFYIRDEPDGTLYLRLRQSVEAGQFSVQDNYLVITILDTDTAPLSEDRYRYDVEITTGGLKHTMQYGEAEVIGDISTEIVGDQTPSYQFYLDDDEHDAVAGANSPSGANVFATMADVGAAVNIVDDTTPQLGGDLDLNGKNIDFPSVANISDVKDEDDMASDSATALATQQSIKAYVDGNSLPSSNAAVETGTYTGDGSTSQQINLTDSSMVVKWVYVANVKGEWGAAAYTDWYKTSDVHITDHADGSVALEDSYHRAYVNKIIAMGTGSFTVDDTGGDSNPNKNGTTYNYYVVGVRS